MTILKRISEINNVGVFSCLNDGAIEFEKLTFIYGLNTYGKSTLTDIFQSLKDNNNDLITARKSIPQIKKEQKVSLSVKENESAKETRIVFEKEKWQENSISKHIEIFGSDFIHKNIFTGLTIERNNKENLTQFILGERGVRLAEEIKQKNKELSLKKIEIKNLVPKFIKEKNKKEINNFIDFSIDGLLISEIESALQEKIKTLQYEEDRLKQPSKILDLKNANKLEIPGNDLLASVEAINTLFSKDYDDIKEESFTKLTDHLLTNFLYKDSAENWIQTGLSYCKDSGKSNCPFCGQSLNEAQALIKVYHTYFDAAYNEFIIEITQSLNQHLNIIKNTFFNKKVNLSEAIIIFNQYKEIVTDSDFQRNLKKLQQISSSIDEEAVNLTKNQILSTMETKKSEKTKFPYKKTEPVDILEFATLLNQYFNDLNAAQEIIGILIDRVNDLKHRYADIGNIKKLITTLTTEIEKLEYKKMRIEQDGECHAYNESNRNITALAEGIEILTKQLQNDQFEYLELYFEEINKIFKMLGSKDFKLEKENDGIDTRGHMPVYSLKIKFRDVPVANDMLNSIFSESDRRALALSVFLAKIKLKNHTDKLKTVLILDDPMTSFDENRMKNIIDIFKEFLRNLSQIVILTHYPNFIKRFCENTKGSKINSSFLNINKNESTSYLEKIEKEFFTASDYEKIFLKIYRFINNPSSECIKSDLRPFLENLYLPTVFAKKIEDKKISRNSTLAEKIDAIFDYDKEINEKFHDFKDSLNPEHHIFTSGNPEDLRSFAQKMMDYLYSLNYEIT